MSILSDKLREKRRASGLKVQEVLDRLKEHEVYISDKTLYHWENGKRNPNADEFFALCEIYKVESLNEFREIEKSPAPEGAEDEDRIIDEFESDLRRVLNKHGLLIGNDLCDADSDFLSDIISIIDAYFKKGI